MNWALFVASLIGVFVLGVFAGARLCLWPDKNRLPDGPNRLLSLEIVSADGDVSEMLAEIAKLDDQDILHIEWANARITGVAGELRPITTIR